MTFHRAASLISAIACLALPALAQSAPVQAAPTEAAPVQAAQAVDKSITAPRHADWTAILSRYVRPGADGLNRFDYGALKASAADRAALDAYIARIAGQDWASLPREEQFVSWGNLYNALTIRHIIGRYPIDSIRDGYWVGPWKEKIVTVNGRGQMSLDDIEHATLRAEWDEPRIHYMVNCASVGCPNLRTAAWEVTSLDADLDDAARAYINSPRGVTIRRDGRLEVSTIYKWFREDFGDSEQGVIAHFLKYASPELAARINARPDIRSYEYDWSLNDTRN